MEADDNHTLKTAHTIFFYTQPGTVDIDDLPTHLINQVIKTNQLCVSKESSLSVAP